MPAKTVKQFSLQTVFIYVTERCNLNCTYCYFRHKKERDIDLKVLEAFFFGLSQSGLVPGRFEISGGEPLLCWDKVKVVVCNIERHFSGRRIGVQTNGLLLTREKIRFVKKHNLALELGIDGDMEVTTRWRGRMGVAGYKRLVSNIRVCLREGVSIGCNMTVHPGDVEDIVRNGAFLHSLGVRSIDVTPAAFMRWSGRAIDEFKVQYAKLMALPEIRSKIYTQEDTGFIMQPFLDLSFHPPGHVLCGDAYLCLSDREKERCSLWDRQTGKFRPEVVRFFLHAYALAKRKLRRKAYTHRDYVCASFQIVNDLIGKQYVNTGEIIPLMRFLTRIHLSS